MRPALLAITKAACGPALAQGFSLDVAVTTSHFTTMFESVRMQAGLAIVPATMVQLLEAGLVSRALLRPEVNRPIGLLRLSNGEMSHAATEFAALLQDSFQGSA
jgi:DNA-binding transcriptional LysR family regulator